jgi:hypothetical protein
LSSFGIKAFICSSAPSYYVGDDNALWDWLLADNGVPVGLPDMQLVPAPPGYKFLQTGAIEADKTEAEGLLVFTKWPRDEKACKLLEVLRFVEPEVFAALSIDKSRIMTISV